MTTPVEILKKYWGYDRFRPLQEEIIDSVLKGDETIALLPTGGGKSICFQVPAMLLEGICIVVSPLIALMKDQVEQLNRRNIKATALFSGMSRKEIDVTLDNCIYGDFKFLYVSPERLLSDLFLKRAEKMQIGLLAIDEAHCISQWGYDFRPPYLRITEFKERFQIKHVIALTATATAQVKEDIASKLGMKDPVYFQKSFARFNLSYSAFDLEDKYSKLLQILGNVPGSSLVYVRSRKRTAEIAGFLEKNGISASFYHAGLSPVERTTRQEKWIKNHIRVMVSTNAFGMGIDKPDVRTVIHMDLPDTLEAYYQEAGRAGRDERKAFAVLLYNSADIEDLHKRVKMSHVKPELIKRVYQALANNYKLAVGSGENSSFEFHYDRFVQTFNLPRLETFYALRKLEEEGLILITEGFYQPSRLMFTISHDEMYRFQVANQPMDPLIKVLLRLYGGELYTQFTTIKESEISHLLNLPKDQVHKKLELLNQYDVVEYSPTSTQPHLTFVTPRMDTSNLPLDIEMINWRREIAEKKAKKVEEYLTHTHVCRTRKLQEYFDEITEENCGVCDYCIAQKKSGSTLKPSVVLDLLKESDLKLDDIMIRLNITQAVAMDAIRELLDLGKVSYDPEKREVILADRESPSAN